MQVRAEEIVAVLKKIDELEAKTEVTELTQEIRYMLYSMLEHEEYAPSTPVYVPNYIHDIPWWKQWQITCSGDITSGVCE